ncbi:MAG: TrmH family RNA methyltransferase [Candidatus Polarisedimenticolia bacterium]
MAPPGPPPIESPQNPLVRRLRALARERSARERSGGYLVWGLHLALEALEARAPVREAIVGSRLEGGPEGRGLLERLRREGAPLRRMGDRALEAIEPGSADQGILLVVEHRPIDPGELLERRPALCVATHGVQDPGNLGGILRSAWGFGAGGAFVLEGCADPFGSRVARAAMGAHFRLPIARSRGAVFVAAARRAGIRLVAADLAGDRLPEQADLTGCVAILLGAEGTGLPPELLRSAELRVRIPMPGGAASLNVHAAAAILLYEAWRQGRGPGGGRNPGGGGVSPGRSGHGRPAAARS